MSEFFGIPMNAALAIMLALLAVVVGSVLWVRWRQRILFDIGLRNIPRRRAQSALIVVGLMLSTVIFAAALSTGDTVTYSITNDAYEKLGHVDEIVQVLGSVPRHGPGSVMIHVPRAHQLLTAVNRHLRNESSLPKKLQELAMLVTARELDCQHIWNAHAASARKAGVPGELVEMTRRYAFTGMTTTGGAIPAGTYRLVARVHPGFLPAYDVVGPQLAWQP